MLVRRASWSPSLSFRHQTCYVEIGVTNQCFELYWDNDSQEKSLWKIPTTLDVLSDKRSRSQWTAIAGLPHCIWTQTDTRGRLLFQQLHKPLASNVMRFHISYHDSHLIESDCSSLQLSDYHICFCHYVSRRAESYSNSLGPRLAI